MVHCHYCYVFHSHLESYPFDDHDLHGLHDLVLGNDVLMNLDDHVMSDDHYDVHLSENVFDLRQNKKKFNQLNFSLKK